MEPLSFSLAQLAQELGAEIHGDPHCKVTAIATLESAKPGTIGFLANPKYLEQLKTTQASIVILTKESLPHCPTNALVVDNPYFALAKLGAKFSKTLPPEAGVHPTATLGDDCHIKPSVSIGPNVVIGDGVTLGERVVIEAGSVIGARSVIGDGTHIYPQVTIYHGIQIGARCILHSGAVIGADGFGFAQHAGAWHKVPQLGGVVLGDDVEVGANTTIDRGAIESTQIGNGVKLDNQIQVAHNVHIGAHTVVAGCTAIAGSVKIGKYCMIGGGSSISGHISIADGVILLGQTQVGFSITEKGTYSSGLGCLEKGKWYRNIVHFYKLDELSKRVKTLEKLLAERKS